MIAMALSCSPKVLIADEPTTALDVTIQAQIMDLLAEIKEETDTAIILITHDLGVVAGMADRVAVMYAGKIVETGTVQDVFYRNAHPYTQALLKSLPTIDSDKKDRLVSIAGTPPDLLNPPKGCGFAARCKHCMHICKEEQPPEFTVGRTTPPPAGCCTPTAPAPKKGERKMSTKNSEVLLSLEDICKYFKVSGGVLKAVDHDPLTSTRARPWAWWGSLAAASLPWPGGHGHLRPHLRQADL